MFCALFGLIDYAMLLLVAEGFHGYAPRSFHRLRESEELRTELDSVGHILWGISNTTRQVFDVLFGFHSTHGLYELYVLFFLQLTKSTSCTSRFLKQLMLHVDVHRCDMCVQTWE